MITDDKIKRINELYKKAKSQGLTEQEQSEQKRLRQEYVQAVRGSLKNRLESIILVDEKGQELGPITKGNKFIN
ncbi:MAG TPA: hypothetical protein DDY49_03890 [Paenibacillaceae bacterium]|nr:hypothetical protein [Paenibacillaceae bacterium]